MHTQSNVHKKENKYSMLCISDDSDNETEKTQDITINKTKQTNIQYIRNNIHKKTEDSNIINNAEYKHSVQTEIKPTTTYIPPTTLVSQSLTHKLDKSHKQYNNAEHDILLYNNTIINIGDTMKLHSIWTVWKHENSDSNWGIESYKAIYEINSIGGLWRFLHVFDNLDKTVRQYYVMRHGILPIWEDNDNRNGGICSIMINNIYRYTQHVPGNNIGVDTFIACCILILNESFILHNANINGICYSVKNRNVLIKLWVKNYDLNKNFKEILPLTLLNKVNVILNINSNKYKSQQSNISIQYKPITPE
jgi:hypothetical protein